MTVDQRPSMRLSEVVATSNTVAATRARSAKIEAFAALLRNAGHDEVGRVASFLAGEPMQGRIGVGWAAIASAVENEPADVATLTIADVDQTLSALANTSGAGSQAARAALLSALFVRATATESLFLRSLFLGDLRQGALEGLVLEGVAKGAGVATNEVRRALMLGGELVPTVNAAFAGTQALAGIHLEVGRAIRPMLASSASTTADALASVGGAASVEWKLDGARIQVHRQGHEVRIFTRNLNDITHRLDGVVDVVRRLPVEAVVLDGETLSLDEEGRPRAFQDSMSRFGADELRPEKLHAFFFDVLHVDGEDLIDRPLSERISILDRVAGTWRVPGLVTVDPVAATEFADDAVRKGHEGVVVKAIASTYEAGRRGKSWVKVKPVRTLDLVVLGVEWGHGRRKGWLSNIHLGARDAGTGDVVMVGKTFKGLTDEVLRWQTQRFLELERGREGIIVWVRPEQVVEIALDGAQVSTRYAGGVALRFARVVRYRDDKPVTEIDSLDDVRALLATGHADEDT